MSYHLMISTEPIIIRTWRGNRNGSILLTIPELIKKQYNLQELTHLVLEQHHDGIFLKKLDLSKGSIQN